MTFSRDAQPRVPDDVCLRVAAAGRAGHDWLDAFPARVAELVDVWNLTLGAVLGGGWSVVIAATTARGEPAVLKVAVPRLHAEQGSFDDELRALVAANGRGYVRVLEADPARGAVLLERLGPSVRDLGMLPEEQLDAISATLRRAWRAPTDADTFRRGDAQALDLARSVTTAPPSIAEVAARYAHERAASVGALVDAGQGVVIHGDAWTANVLQAPDGGYKLIDPDPMVSEPAHDLAIALRDLTSELRAAGLDLTRTMRRWCDRVAGADVDPNAVWQWAFVERVSTGWFLTKLGDPYGDVLLAAAVELAYSGE